VEYLFLLLWRTLDAPTHSMKNKEEKGKRGLKRRGWRSASHYPILSTKTCR
jgi:hypothetical protein